MDVVGVHGIGKHQLGRVQLVNRWRPALIDGIERVTGYPAPSVRFDLAFYGDLFLPDVSRRRRTKAPVIDDPLSTDDELAFLTEIAEENAHELSISVEEAVTGFKGPPPVPRPLRPLVGVLARRVGLDVALATIPVLRQVWRYLRDDELAAKARARVSEVLGDTCRVLIGHSLGSVIAYETLLLENGPGVDSFATLGSPLGLRAVTRRLRLDDKSSTLPTPSRGARWINIFDKGDPVACAGGLSRHNPEIHDEDSVHNGSDPHSVERYLSKAVTGQVIVPAETP